MRSALRWWLVLLAASFCFAIYSSTDLRQAIGAGATSVVRPLVVPLVELINVPAFVYVVATLIVFAGVVACVGYRLQSVQPRLRQLRRVRLGVNDLPFPSGLPDRDDWPAAAHRLGQLLIENTVFIFAWSEYQAEASRRNAVPSAPFSNYIATEPEGVKTNSVLMRSLPGYFTSLGLIMTFIGLVVALYFAAKGFRTGNIEDARAAIIQLLNAASFKFLTSVAALISAFAISVFLRYNLSVIAQETMRTVERIEVFLATWREHVGTGHVQRSGLSDEISARLDTLSQNIQDLTAVILDFRLLVEARPKESADAFRR